MLVARTTRLFGLALALSFVPSGFTGMGVAQDKKDEKKAEDKKKVKAKLVIHVPQDNAELTIEKEVMSKPTGLVREYEIPELTPGKDYEYSFTVVWHPNNYTTLTRTKNVEFKGGEDLNIDLTKVNPKIADKAVIRWVPTPDDIVEKMMELGKVGSGDVVYEPGPGDGRVLIASIKHGAKKAVGIEIDSKKAA